MDNIKDNWNALLGPMDIFNQAICMGYIKRRDTKEFLIKMRVHYMFPKPVLEWREGDDERD